MKATQTIHLHGPHSTHQGSCRPNILSLFYAYKAFMHEAEERTSKKNTYINFE